jgi:ketosteroid isomerase-like protein
VSQENKEAARRLLDAIWQRDLAHILELTDPEIEWHSFFALQGEAYHGHDGMRQYLDDVHDAFEDLRPEISDLLDGGDVVIGVGYVHYRGRTSGVETESAAGWMFRFRQGKVVQFRAFSEPEQHLEAVGLPR